MEDYKGSITAKITASIIWVFILFGVAITTYSLVELRANLTISQQKDADHLTLLIEREAATSTDRALLRQRIKNILFTNFDFAAVGISIDGIEQFVIRKPDYPASRPLVAMEGKEVAFTNTNGQHHGLVVTFYHVPFFQVLNDRRTEIIVTFGVPLLGIAALLFFITHHVVTKPLLQVVSAIKKVANGDMTQRVDIHRNDELGTLANFFNSMLDDLSSKQTALQTEIRERENIQQSLAQHATELKRANSESMAFNYTVSHDLRAPLRAIRGFSEALMEDCEDQLDDNGKHLLQRISLAAERMDHLTNDILDLSRISRQEIVLCTVDLSAMAQEICDQLQENEPSRRPAVTIQPGLHVTADPAQMHIVMSNLLGNAWKYTSKTENHVIEMGMEDERDGMHVFFVKDNGAGFDMQYADRLFTPFKRLHNSTDYEGNGIGLATVLRIIERHNGTIWAQAKPDQGACFYFSLPNRESQLSTIR